MSGLVEKKKRARAANFTAEEVRLLIRLALKEKHILENKQTDSEVWKLKSKTWEKIAEVFNASSGQIFRPVDTLKLKYDGLKKELKKKVNKNKAETMKTGGGNPDYIVIDGPENELLEVLSLSVHGLPPVFDSDNALPQTTITGEMETFDIPMITVEEIETYNLPEEVIEVIPINLANNTEPEFQAASGSETPMETVEDKKPHSSGAWKDWSPGVLKSKKHPILTPRKKRAQENTSKVDKILNLREELVRKQIKYLDEEEKRAKEKHEKEMKLLDLEIKIKEKLL